MQVIRSLTLGVALMLGIMWAFRNANPGRANRGFKIAQTVSAAAMALGEALHAYESRGMVQAADTREAARGVLPNSTETKIVVTGNARAWRTMLELRLGEGASKSIELTAVREAVRSHVENTDDDG